MEPFTIHFANPAVFGLTAAAIVALAGVAAYATWARKRQIEAFAHAPMLPRLLASLSPLRRWLKFALVLLAVVFLGLALARPQWGEETETAPGAGEDTIFVLDTSKSMLAADVRPNRLERAKLAIQDYLRRHGQGRVGLVVFSGQAFLQCPLTLDYDAFVDTLREVDENAVPVPGSDLARALDEASRALEKNEGRKIIVLLTDGEDLAGRGIEKARGLAQSGVQVYAIGVGTQMGSEVRIMAEPGDLQTLLDREGRPVISRLDEKTLREVAAITSGHYQLLGGVGDGMDRIRQAVADPTRGSDAFVRTRRIDRFHFPLAIALALLLAEPLLRERRRSPAV
jgi:Ca-activated chloride channel family protein